MDRADAMGIDRALAKAKRLGLIDMVERKIERGLNDTTLILVQWPPLFAAYERVETFRGIRAGAKSHQTRCENAPTMCENAVQNYSYINNSIKGNNSRSPDG